MREHLLLFLIPVLLALSVLGHLRTRGTFTTTRIRISHRQLHLALIPALFPILAVLGATLLNNGGPNIITLIMLAGISLYALILVVKHEAFSDGVYISSVFFTALALLLMTSLRSWHITGFDINQEFQVFELTKVPLQWAMTHLQDPYNACLSITILPTMFSQLMNISDEYIFKAVFQLCFAVMPVALYLFARKYSPKPIAFLAVFFFIGQVFFFQGMPTLTRQEFAVLFFTLIIATIFDDEIKRSLRRWLVIIYSLAMVLSHYSTTYVAIALLLVAFLIYSSVVSRPGQMLLVLVRLKAKRSRPLRITRHIKSWHLGLLIAFTLTWNLGVTQTSSGLIQFLGSSATNINQVFNQATISNAIKQMFFPYPSVVTLEAYTHDNFAAFRQGHPGFIYYPAAQTATPNIHLVDFAGVASHLGSTVHTISAGAFKLLKITINYLFILVGTIYLFHKWQKGKFMTGEYSIIAISSFILVALLLVLPGALKEYNIERLYFQQLITWAPAGVFGGLIVMSLFKSLRLRYGLLAGLYILQLLFYTGFIFNFTGGPALISTTNYGEDYEKFYTHQGEVNAAEWLGARVADQPIFTSSPGRNKLSAYAEVPATHVVIDTHPSIIDKNSYVYLTYLNTVGDKSLFVLGGDEHAFNFQTQFFDDNKDKVYTNQVSTIYK